MNDPLLRRQPINRKGIILIIASIGFLIYLLTLLGCGGGVNGGVRSATPTGSSPMPTTTQLPTPTGSSPVPSLTPTSAVTPTQGPVADPIIWPSQITFEAKNILVTIETIDGAKIMFTSEAGIIPATQYSSPHTFILDRSRTIQAVAVKNDVLSHTSMKPYDLYWWQSLGFGLDNTVWALALDSEGNLYIGGDFTREAGGSGPDLNRIIKYNPQTHNITVLTTSPGLNNRVKALAYNNYNGKLYIGGQFTADQGGAVTLRYLASYDNISNSFTEIGTNGTVDALALDESILYAGGQFTKDAMNIVTLNHVAKWDSILSPIGTAPGVNNEVSALHFSAATLYVGGNFSDLGYAATYNKAGNQFSGILPLISGHPVYAFCKTYNLYAGTAGDRGLYKHHLFQGNMVWSVYGDLTGGAVNALAYDENHKILYIGGGFNIADTNDSYIARMRFLNEDESLFNLNSFGNGLIGDVNALIYDSNRDILYVGGNFTIVDGIDETAYIVKWGKK